MEGSPDEEHGQPGRAAHGPRRQPAPPNLWILLGITVLSLAITVLVLILTAIGG